MRTWYRLSAAMVANASRPGKYLDGGGLILHVRDGGSRQWAFRYQRNGRKRALGLGPVRTVTLAEARERAHEARRLIAAGHDPLDQRKATRQAEQAAAAKLTTVRQVAALYFAKHEARWSNDKHRREWKSSIDRLVLPVIGNLSVAEIETAHVLKVIEPLWSRIPMTADRVRGRIEALLDYAKVAGLREAGDNPASWDGHLAALLPAPRALKPVVHHAAMDYRNVPAFMATLRAEPGVAARALEFIILTGVRLSEAIFARWDEIDTTVKTWTIPPARMKRRKEHVVPLAARPTAILDEMRGGHAVWVFPGSIPDKAISDNSIDRLRKRLGADTAHGFRASFRTWAEERTGAGEAVCEQALAHAVKAGVIAAYKRTTLFDQRKRLMSQWSVYCASATEITGRTVVPLRARHG
jgi:integrase